VAIFNGISPVSRGFSETNFSPSFPKRSAKITYYFSDKNTEAQEIPD
jgi:hypothetical protein